ncbi:MAG TPA: acireductone synthase, partial [Spongiibacteraceae bacterium]|nr:acireductone synthase [Spongiibacteraceae bacterium]
GHYRAHVYPDAAAQLRSWHARGLPLYVYSSGSIAAQKLFFEFSEAGNLLPLFSGHFDTTVGAKGDAASYQRICNAIELPAGNLLFLSDVEAELNAARAAGWHTCWLQRPQDVTASAGSGHHPIVQSFADIEAALQP